MNLRQTRHYKIRTAMKQEQVPEADSCFILCIHILFSVLPSSTGISGLDTRLTNFKNGDISIEDFERIALRQ